jgi:hypothetical protein
LSTGRLTGPWWLPSSPERKVPGALELRSGEYRLLELRRSQTKVRDEVSGLYAEHDLARRAAGRVVEVEAAVDPLSPPFWSLQNRTL